MGRLPDGREAIYLGTADARLVALDGADGRVLWQAELGSSAVLVTRGNRGMVIFGFLRWNSGRLNAILKRRFSTGFGAALKGSLGVRAETLTMGLVACFAAC